VRPEPTPSQPLEIWLSDILDGVACVVIVGLVVESLTGTQGIPRILVALGFLLFVPGRAVTANWDRVALRSQATDSMLLSLVVLALLATVTLWVHYWHPIGLMQAEAGLSLLALAIAVARRHWYRRRARPVAQDSSTGSTGGGPSALAGVELLMMMSRPSAESEERQGHAAHAGEDQITRDSSGNAAMTPPTESDADRGRTD